MRSSDSALLHIELHIPQITIREIALFASAVDSMLNKTALHVAGYPIRESSPNPWPGHHVEFARNELPVLVEAEITRLEYGSFISDAKVYLRKKGEEVLTGVTSGVISGLMVASISAPLDPPRDPPADSSPVVEEVVGDMEQLINSLSATGKPFTIKIVDEESGKEFFLEVEATGEAEQGAAPNP